MYEILIFSHIWLKIVRNFTYQLNNFNTLWQYAIKTSLSNNIIPLE